MVDLLQLAERCERAEGPDHALDTDISVCLAGDPDSHDWHNHKWLAYSGSIDAAMTLVPEGMTFSVDEGPAHWIVTGKERAAGRALVYRLNPDRDLDTGLNSELVEHGFAATPALALCAASLRARVNTQDGEG